MCVGLKGHSFTESQFCHNIVLVRLSVFVSRENQIAQSTGGIKGNVVRDCLRGVGRLRKNDESNDIRELLPLLGLKEQGSGSRNPGRRVIAEEREQRLLWPSGKGVSAKRRSEKGVWK